MAFRQVGIVKALGNSITKTDYSFLDESANGKQYQYRVQAVNLDKESAYSEIKSISLKCDSKDIKLYPNPTLNETNILIKSNNDEYYKIKVFDIYGNMIYENAMAVNNETKIISINTSNWATGNYVMIANNGKESKIVKFAKTN